MDLIHRQFPKDKGLKAKYKNLHLTQDLEYQRRTYHTFHLPRDLTKTTAPDGRSYTLTISTQHRLLNTSILHIDNFHLAGDLTQTNYHSTWWRTLNSSTEQDNFPPAQGSCADNFRTTEALKYKHRTRQFTTCPGWILCRHSAPDRGPYIHTLLSQQRHLNNNNSDGYLEHSLNVHVFKIQHTHKEQDNLPPAQAGSYAVTLHPTGDLTYRCFWLNSI